MKKISYSILMIIATFFSLRVGHLNGTEGSFPLPAYPLVTEPELVIHNRPLAKINGQVISLYDVVKKMNLFLFEYSQTLSLSPVEKYQFYVSRWEKTLEEMIDDQLVLLDASQKEIKVSDAEVREELDARFGPEVLSNLHRLGYEHGEAQAMIRQELTVQHLIGMKVHVKAFQATTPEVIKKAYQAYLEKNPPQEEWSYQVLSIRGQDSEKCQKVAEAAYHLLNREKQSIEDIPSLLAEEKEVSLRLSEACTGSAQKLSKMDLEVLQTLTPHSYSAPILQISRFDNQPVVRIFYLKALTKNLPQSLDAMHDLLKNQMLVQNFEKEKKRYIQSLKKWFGYQNHDPKFELSEDYQPFSLL